MATTRKTTKTATVNKPAVESKPAENIVKEVKEEVEPRKKIMPLDVDPRELIPVRNGYRGGLIYKSLKSGETFVWNEFGDVQEIELSELKNIKASRKKFFTQNWFMFDEEYDWVIDYLGLRQYYANSLTVDNFDELFTKTPAEVSKILASVPDGQKRSIMYRARQLIANGEIDSNKVIAALENGLGVQLIEK